MSMMLLYDKTAEIKNRRRNDEDIQFLCGFIENLKLDKDNCNEMIVMLWEKELKRNPDDFNDWAYANIKQLKKE